ncbi:protein-(glutamine-N5) methyltransferase, release factor-specific [Stenotrophomonas maltophilia]|uniref:peptide chain release factor N(5)-glutamine methyltransferase n=1 Tax=Stenotrophomonas maltophilia TaxID=40324 RepID=UPI000B4E7C80|nr:peptide chain release factor N(5)-glutamine methyltransferase [Stenotrophomonas maltophilia]MPS45679.1 peptide chain release factor N(5)-glutamine methyltransferase [Stenotrophomonas sp.]MBA0386074.1 peptide chain release factor N(5)-glutamine methyltransferase [Stenotrophomonas maltophilia]OWQ80957.1 protein-(glutamine-N5) methyltransferase, release factor-specific [Stenotrophomonas maltophilia]PJL05003.1 protein-(glutamine-N5) methyltransferase, release factor-specific [Stenotrophomonas ma
MSFQTEPSLRQVVADASARLGGIDARHEAELLLLHVLDRPRSWLFAHATDPLAANDQAAFEALLARRVAGEPVAYLTGRRGFWTLDLEVDPATLIPRPETELLVELALERLPPGRALQLADLGTGSGAIALALASERPQAQVLATDASPGALAVAARNAARHELRNVRFAEGGHDWYAPLQGARFDLIASNPPYIASDDPHLEQGDLRFEPATALASGPDGLDDIRRIIGGGQAHLVPGGWLLIEHGWDQGEAIRALFDTAGFAEVQTVQDLEQRDRITQGRRPA